MEKFGIFELLDALSALTAREEPNINANPAAPADPPKAAPSTKDVAFSAPVYGFSPEESSEKDHTPQPQPQAETTAPPEPAKAEPPKKNMEADALAGFYARHDRISKKIKR